MKLGQLIYEASYCEDMRAEVFFQASDGTRYAVKVLEIRAVKSKEPVIELEEGELGPCLRRIILKEIE